MYIYIYIYIYIIIIITIIRYALFKSVVRPDIHPYSRPYTNSWGWIAGQSALPTWCNKLITCSIMVEKQTHPSHKL